MFQFSIVSTVLVIVNALQHKKCYNVLESQPSLILPSVNVRTRPINTGFMDTLLRLQPKNQILFGGKHQSENYRKLTEKNPAKYGRSSPLLSTVTWPVGLYNNN